MAHTCKPSTLGGRGGWITRSRDRDHPGQHGETTSLLKIQKISWAWWCVPIIPATQEAEAGELPEPRRWRLRWAEIAPLHSSLGNKSETPSQKKKKSNRIFSLKKDEIHRVMIAVLYYLCVYQVEKDLDWFFRPSERKKTDGWKLHGNLGPM